MKMEDRHEHFEHGADVRGFDPTPAAAFAFEMSTRALLFARFEVEIRDALSPRRAADGSRSVWSTCDAQVFGRGVSPGADSPGR